MVSKRTLELRREFRTNFNPITSRVVGLVARGWESPRIADKLDLEISSVGAIRANLTRGTYFPYATVGSKGNVVGSCQF